jgi:hypothetical protein
MSVENTAAFTGLLPTNGVTTVFPWSFYAASADEIQVYVDDVLRAGGTYTVSRAADGTGSVTITPALASGKFVRIVSDPDFTQEAEFQRFGPFFPDLVNDPFDRAAARDIKLRAETDRALQVPIGETPPSLPSAAGRASKFLAFDASGNPIASSGTGADAGLRDDLADPAIGGRLNAFRQAGAGAVVRTDYAKLAERITPEDYGAVGSGLVTDRASFVNAANEAVARGQYLRGRKGAIYLLDATANLPAGLRFDGEGCTIKATSHITMIELAANSLFVNCQIIGADDGVYNAAGMGIRFRGTDSGVANTPPNWKDGLVVEGVEFIGLGHTGLDMTYARNIRTRDLATLRMGYAGGIGYSVEDYDGFGYDLDTFFGETGSGELNAYAWGFTSAVSAGDDVRYPPSRRCYAHHGTVRNLPTWHALDTHGGRNIGFAGWIMTDVRRAVAITNRGDDSAHDCYVRNIRSINSQPFGINPDGSLTAESLNSNGTLKRDCALWLTGLAASPSRGVKVDNFYAEGHGVPGRRDATFFIENGNYDVNNVTDKSGWLNSIRVNGGFTGSIKGHLSLDVTSWNPAAYPGGSWAQVNGNSAPRPLDMTGDGNDFDYEGKYERTSALPAGVAALDALVIGASATNKVELVGNGIKNKTGGGLAITGDAAFVTGNYTRGETLTAGAGQFSAAVTGVVMCNREGDVKTLEFPLISGTSASAAFTLATLLPNFRPIREQSFVVSVVDNGTASFGLMTISTAGVVTLLLGAGGSGWTATGTKSLKPCTVSFV